MRANAGVWWVSAWAVAARAAETALRLGDASKIWIYGFYTLTYGGLLAAGLLVVP